MEAPGFRKRHLVDKGQTESLKALVKVYCNNTDGIENCMLDFGQNSTFRKSPSIDIPFVRGR